MFIVIVEKRISCEVTHQGDKVTEQDWFVLLVKILPFAPVEGTIIQLEPDYTIQFECVVYNPNNGTFNAKTASRLHPIPDAETCARELVMSGRWEEVAPENGLATAKDLLIKKTLRKIQSSILRAAPQVASGKQLLNFLHSQGGGH